jgi:DNA repair exonuclease SbcCD ATPase subunit
MPTASIRFTDSQYAELKQRAESANLSISDFVRHAVEEALADEAVSVFAQDTRVLQQQLQDRDQQIEFLRQQLLTLQQSQASQVAEKAQQLQKLHDEVETKNQQIEQLHQLVAMAQTTANELTQQLKSSHLQLEDLRDKQHRSVWQRLASPFLRGD